MNIQFSKYQGTGNDFIIIDNRMNDIHLSVSEISFLCDRRKGIGADGLMLLGKMEGFDFSMTYFNADGNEGSMCGNGGRCLVQFAFDIGIKKESYYFLAIDGPHEASIDSKGWVRLKMSDVDNIEHQLQNDTSISPEFFVTNTGSPHYIQFVENLKSIDVYTDGKKIRFNDRFSAQGINVNFAEQQPTHLFVRTYERGVENETFSCGTGVTAVAIVSCLNKKGPQHIPIETLGGYLAVTCNHKENGQFDDIWLLGPGTFVFKGTLVLP